MTYLKENPLPQKLQNYCDESSVRSDSRRVRSLPRVKAMGAGN